MNSFYRNLFKSILKYNSLLIIHLKIQYNLTYIFNIRTVVRVEIQKNRNFIIKCVSFINKSNCMIYLL